MTIELLRGMRIIELSLIIPGNQTGGLLADLGADVIKIEPPPFGDYIREVFPVDREKRVSGADFFFNRNKRSLTVDLKTDEGREIFYRLLKTADAVFDLSLPGTRERLKVDYETCRAIKPDIVYCALTGFGYSGPYAKIPAHGYGPNAVAGNIPIVPLENGRYTVGTPTDGGARPGPLYAALGLVSALLRKQLTGEGCFIETSLVDASVHTRFLEVYQHFNPRHQWEPMLVGAGSARYTVYECADGKFVMFCPIEYKFWKRFCEIIDRTDLLQGGGWGDRVMDFGRQDDALEAELAAIFKTRPMAEWIELVGRQGVPCTPAHSFTTLMDDKEYVDAREMTVTYHDDRLDDEITLSAFPVKRPGTPYTIERRSPKAGEHNDEVLAELGYSADEIRALRGSGVVFEPIAPGTGVSA